MSFPGEMMPVGSLSFKPHNRHHAVVEHAQSERQPLRRGTVCLLDGMMRLVFWSKWFCNATSRLPVAPYSPKWLGSEAVVFYSPRA